VNDQFDPIRLQQAAHAANIPTLIAVLYQLTGDRRWLSERYRPTRSRGMDDNRTGGLNDPVQAEIRAAFNAAMHDWVATRSPARPTLGSDELQEVLNFVMGETVPHEFAPMMGEILEFTRFQPRRPQHPDADFSVIVIGAGVAGMLASVRLADAGIAHVVLEKNSEVGGSWWENTYPGAGVDTPSYLYSYSFFPGSWASHFAKRDEVQTYLADFADHFQVRRNVQFDTEVMATRYDQHTQRWITTARRSDGSTTELSSNAVISAVGLLNRPKLPDISGLADFRGHIFHSARWPETIDLTDRRVAIVGSGASAMQIGPAIADTVRSLTIFQRSPQWIAPNDDYFAPIGDHVHWLMENVPFYRVWYRARLSWIFNDKVHASLQVDPEWSEPKRSINAINDGHRAFYTRYLNEQLGTRRDLVAKCLPDYPPFGKRMLLDNGWFSMLKRHNVELITSAVHQLTPSGVIDAAGTRHDFDVIILATGFHTDRLLYPMRITGRSGRTTTEVWGEHDAWAYLGITVPDFPNLFVMTGPNTALGHGGSFITIAECQIRFIMDALCQMIDRRIGALECRHDVAARYKNAVDDAHAKMIWTHPGMDNWYRNDAGRVVAVLPWRIVDYWQMTNQADLANFTIEAATARTRHVGPTTMTDQGESHSTASVRSGVRTTVDPATCRRIDPRPLHDVGDHSQQQENHRRI
jgi:4-hydroxyacetophenone monooxygenase